MRVTEEDARRIVGALSKEYARKSKLRGLSQTKAAERIGITRQRLSDLQSGKTLCSLHTFMSMQLELDAMEKQQ